MLRQIARCAADHDHAHRCLLFHMTSSAETDWRGLVRLFSMDRLNTFASPSAMVFHPSDCGFQLFKGLAFSGSALNEPSAVLSQRHFSKITGTTTASPVSCRSNAFGISWSVM